MLSPLGDPIYRRLFAAQVIALAGTGLSTVALALLAYDLAGGNAGKVLGTALAIKMVAYVAIAPGIGGLAHRLPRKAFLVALDLARAASVLCLPFVDAIWQVYVLIFLLSAGSAAFTPTFQAAIPDILPDEARYTEALSLSRLAYDLEHLVSPIMAAVLLSVMTFDSLFAGNGIAFIVSALLVLSVALPRPLPSDRPAGVLFNLRFGVRSYLATPRLRGLLFLSFAVAAAGAMMIVNSVIYVRAYLEGSETDLAIAFAASGAGSMLAALCLPRLFEMLPERPVMLAGGALMGLALMLGATRPGFLALLVLWFVLGLGSSLVQTPSGRLLRSSCRPADRSAYFAAQFALSHACWLVAYPLAGWLGAAAGLPIAFAVLAALVGAASFAALLVWPAGQSFVLTHDHRAVEHAHLHVHDEHHMHGHEGWEGPEPHSHPHRHASMKHRHSFVIDSHHSDWPAQ
ncbi:MAG: MFS transporter [Kiloniellaceae bacterium]